MVPLIVLLYCYFAFSAVLSDFIHLNWPMEMLFLFVRREIVRGPPKIEFCAVLCVCTVRLPGTQSLRKQWSFEIEVNDDVVSFFLSLALNFNSPFVCPRAHNK